MASKGRKEKEKKTKEKITEARNRPLNAAELRSGRAAAAITAQRRKKTSNQSNQTAAQLRCLMDGWLGRLQSTNSFSSFHQISSIIDEFDWN